MHKNSKRMLWARYTAHARVERSTAQQTEQNKVLKTARVGGEGGWDYIYADVDGRRLTTSTPQHSPPSRTATDTTPPAAFRLSRHACHCL